MPAYLLQISYSVCVPKLLLNWLAVDKVSAKISRLTVLADPVYCVTYTA